MEDQNKSNVLLTELVIVVLFFSLIAVTVVQMFVMSHQRGKINAYTQRALIAAQDWAEALSGQPDLEQALLDTGFEKADDGSYQQTAEDGALRIEAHLAPEERTATGRLIGAEIRVVYIQDVRDPYMVLASLPMGSYIPAFD
ncbi:MAG: hypothetical protein FWD25_03010 [Clostridia bacterium]|nr:hypothetical protein [Clostridia bacterium]